MHRFFILLLLYLVCFAELQADSIRKVIIFQTADIHSHITGTNNSWLKLADVLNNERKAADTENFLLIDCGDSLTGSVIGQVSRGMAGGIMLNELQYDVWVPGNHDFELGQKSLLEVCKTLKPYILAGNLQWGKEFIKPWKLYERSGVKIAVIGLTSPHLKEWLHGKEMQDFQVSDLIPALEKIIPQVMSSSPHLIILAVHHGRFSPKRLNGINISKVAKKFPQINLILGAHSHEEVAGEKIGIDSWYVSCGAHAEKVARIDAMIDLDKGHPIRISSRLIPISSSTPTIPTPESLRAFMTKTIQFKSQLIGRTKHDIKISSGLLEHSAMHELFGKAIVAATDAVGAFHGIFDESAVLSKNINGEDLYKVVPFDDTIGILYLNKDEIIAVFKEQMTQKDNYYQSPFGLRFYVDSGEAGYLNSELAEGQVGEWKDKRMPIAFSSYVLAGAGGRFPVLKSIARKEECKGKNTGIYVRDAVEKYISANSPLDIKPVKWITIRH